MASFKYKQVADKIKQMISDGTYLVGQRIPTEPELCDSFGVGRQTIRKAVTVLEEEGYLKRVQGSGTYVCEQEEKEELTTVSTRIVSDNNKSIALVMMNNKSYIFVDVMNGITSYLSEKGYALNIYITDGCYETERQILEKLLAEPPAGILLEPVRSGIRSVNTPLFEKIEKSIPCLLIHSDGMEMFPRVRLNDNLGAKQLTEHIISYGHQKIGTLFTFDECTGQSRYMGVLSALSEHGMKLDSENSLWTVYDKMGDFFEGNKRMELEAMLDRVTAVICHDDRVAYNVIKLLEAKGKRVPEDVSVVGYDNSLFSKIDVQITTAEHPKEAYGRMAAEALLEWIHHPDQFDMEGYFVDPKLIVRDTVGPVKE